jgi:hypothetical protein
VYTPVSGAESAAPGQVIRSATWNSINTDYATALTQIGTGVVPSPQNLQATLGQTTIRVLSQNVNFDAASTDTAIPIVLPTGFTYYIIGAGRVINNGPSATLTTATFAVFSSPSGAGVTIVNNTSVTITSNNPNINNNAQALSINNASTQYYTFGTIYFRLLVPQGTIASANVVFQINPVS